jgi:hypothetical protein
MQVHFRLDDTHIVAVCQAYGLCENGYFWGFYGNLNASFSACVLHFRLRFSIYFHPLSNAQMVVTFFYIFVGGWALFG